MRGGVVSVCVYACVSVSVREADREGGETHTKKKGEGQTDIHTQRRAHEHREVQTQRQKEK